MALLAEHLAALIQLMLTGVQVELMSKDSITEFLLLRKELQQRIPIPQIFSHIDRILSFHPPEDFQSLFLTHVAHFDVDKSLLQKLAAFLLGRFDRIYQGQKYALQDEFVEYLAAGEVGGVGDGKCDRYYELKDEKILHIRASEVLISEGTTGYSLWEASVALLALLSSSNHQLHDAFFGKRVLELGSGTGLGGLAIAALANPCRVLLTDVAQVHDTFTRPNLLLNRLLAANADSAVLHWNDLITDPYEYSIYFDTLVGCDIVYDPEICSLLISAFKAFCHAKNSTIDTIFLICTIRNPETFDTFVSQLQELDGFKVEVSCIDPEKLGDEIVLKSIESFRIIKATKNQ